MRNIHVHIEITQTAIYIYIYVCVCLCVCVVEFSPETLNTYSNGNTMVLNKDHFLYLY